MKISHECPRCLLEKSKQFNDYSYALVHKFKDDSEYFQFFKDELSNDRIVYLDNSLFELETMFNHEDFAESVNELGRINPDKFYYIVPDSLENCDETIQSLHDFVMKYPNLPGKRIGVVQGKNYDELVRCYNNVMVQCNTVAISFDYSYYQKLFPTERNKYFSWMKGRQYLVDKLIQDGIWNFSKEHHLLGCSLPQEFSHYKNIRNIVSCDTSNPVVHAIKGIRYNESGLETKESMKLVDLYETPIENINQDILENNIRIFRGFCS